MLAQFSIYTFKFRAIVSIHVLLFHEWQVQFFFVYHSVADGFCQSSQEKQYGSSFVSLPSLYSSTWRSDPIVTSFKKHLRRHAPPHTILHVVPEMNRCGEKRVADSAFIKHERLVKNQ